MARNDMDQIIAHGKVEHAYLGILPQDVTPALAKSFNTEAKGALVGEVTPNSPASRGGLKTGDIIRDVNGQAIADANQLRLKIGMMTAGTEVKLNVLRDGTPMDVAVKLGEFPSSEQQASLGKEQSNAALQGVTVENITPDVAQEMNLPAKTKGVVVEEVNPASHAADAGLQPGDVIQQVNHQSVKDMRDFNQAMSTTKSNSPVLLLIDRDGNTMFLAV
jgi:serine protease Do